MAVLLFGVVEFSVFICVIPCVSCVRYNPWTYFFCQIFFLFVFFVRSFLFFFFVPYAQPKDAVMPVEDRDNPYQQLDFDRTFASFFE